jgi:pilus assembly protein CpaF
MDSNAKFKGRFRATGVHPQCIEKIKNSGIGINDDWFRE